MTVSSPNQTVFLGRFFEQGAYQYFAHILLPVTDNNLLSLFNVSAEVRRITAEIFS